MPHDQKRKDLIDVMEARRAESDRFAWAVPAVVIASQAFLLTIALDDDTVPVRRLIACAAALVTLVGACHLFWKQAFAFALYEAVIKRERAALKLPLVDRDSLLVRADSLEERFHREWMERDAGGNLVRSATGERNYLPRRTIRVRAVRVWLLIFGLIALLDVVLGLWAIYDWLDPGWFASEPPDDRRRFRFSED